MTFPTAPCGLVTAQGRRSRGAGVKQRAELAVLSQTKGGVSGAKSDKGRVSGTKSDKGRS